MPEPVFTHLVGLGDVDTHFPVGIGRGNAAMLTAKRALALPFGNLGIRLGGEEVKADIATMAGTAKPSFSKVRSNYLPSQSMPCATPCPPGFSAGRR